MLNVDFHARVGVFDLTPRFEASSEFVVLFGPSGCGKSLTLQTIAGLIKPTAGRIVLPRGAVAFDANAGIDLPPQKRSVGYVVQDLALFPHMNARENIAFALHRWPKPRQAERVAHLVQLLDLGGLEDRRADQLSGGQQQRVALARALAAEPSLLLLDEPFSALDAPLRSILRREVATLRRRLDLTAVLVTHDLNEAYALADRIVVMDEGRVLQHGARADIFQRPASRRVAELTETRNIVPGTVIAFAEGVAVVQTPWFIARIRDPETPVRGSVHLCIRPEHVLLLRHGREARHTDDVMLDAEIIEEIPSAHGHRLMMRVVPPDDGSGEALIFEVDVPAHPYDVLGVPGRRDWRIALLAEHISLVSDG